VVIYIRSARNYKRKIRENSELVIRCSKGTPIIKKTTTPFLSKEEQRKKEKNESLDIEQIYGRGFQRGSMPGVTVLAGYRQ
jgi:hypothetical protein